MKKWHIVLIQDFYSKKTVEELFKKILQLQEEGWEVSVKRQ